MAQINSYKYIRGLDLNSNPIYGTPGRDTYGGPRLACQIADNAILTRQHCIGNRRGFNYFTSSTSALIDSLYEYQNDIVQHQADNTLWHGDNASGTRTQYTGTLYAGSFVPPSPYRMDFCVGRGSLFCTSTAGPQKIDAISHTPTRAGLTKGLDTRVAVTGTGNGFLGGFNKAAYRITWLRTDANNQQIRSDVSSAVIITNNNRQTPTSITSAASVATVTTPLAHGFTTGDLIVIAGATQTAYNGTVTITSTGTFTFTYAVSGSPTSPATGTITVSKSLNTNVTFTVPEDISFGVDYWEIWRTVTVDASNADPGDTCYLVARTLNINGAHGTASFTDTTPDSILTGNEALYTNATQEGALQGNSRPPVCSALCTYKDYGIYANTAIDHQLSLELLATISLVAGSSKITLTRTDTLGARTYTFNTSESALNAQIFTGGLSNASNIELTTRSLCHVISSDPAGFWYAEYTSGANDNPGIFRVWARSPLTGSFTVTASDTTTGNQFSPTVPTSGATVLSSNDSRANRLFYSKIQEPDHVPILNTIDVGRLDQPILRVLSVRDACYIIKADGVWYLSGLTAPFSLIELDSTCHCIAPATATTLNNQIYMLSNQGVVQVSLSGVTVVSFDIEPAIMQSVLPLTNLSSTAFGVAHESQRQYMLWVPTVSGDTYSTQAYVFHTFINEWTRWTKPAASGIALNANYTLYISSGLENALLKQRQSGDLTDFSDEELPITVTGQTGFVVTVTWSNSKFTPTAGLTLHQAGSVAKVVTATFVSGSTWHFTVDRTASYANGAATARMPIYAHLRLSPNVCGEAGVLKSLYTVSFFPDSNTMTQVAIEAGTNEAPTLNSYAITRPIIGGWGLGAWGTSTWGDLDNPIKAIPWVVDLPIGDNTGESVTAGWYHSVSQEQFVLAQAAFSFDVLSEVEVAQQS